LRDRPVASRAADRFTRELGFAHLIDVHRGLAITEEQRRRFVALYMAALDDAGMPDDEPSAPRCASTSSSAAGWRCRTPAQRNDGELNPLREVPRWTWDGDD
jgi:hemoglobin